MHNYLHFDIESFIRPHSSENICGDIINFKKTSDYVLVILTDGISHGLKANIYANFISSRLFSLIESGFTFHEAVGKIAKSNRENMGKDLPYGAFTAVKILNNGKGISLCYENPLPLLITKNSSSVIKSHAVSINNVHIMESSFYLSPDEYLLLCTDGITQAGTGFDYTYGWGEENLSQYIKKHIGNREKPQNICRKIQKKIFELNGGKYRDDSTLCLISCRKGNVLNIISGPPSDRALDTDIVTDFIQSLGTHVICGDSTAKMVARHLDLELSIEQNPKSLIAPPRYYLDGFKLVTEGAVTLNQVYNIIDEPYENITEDNAVTVLYSMLRNFDKIIFFTGTASNPGHRDISFTQKGIISRNKIIPLICSRLIESGKLVIIKKY